MLHQGPQAMHAMRARERESKAMHASTTRAITLLRWSDNRRPRSTLLPIDRYEQNKTMKYGQGERMWEGDHGI